MTSFAFIAGVVPLVIAHGAGAEMRRVMGIAVFSGMLGVTFFGLLFTPVFYVLIRGLVSRASAERATPRRMTTFVRSAFHERLRAIGERELLMRNLLPLALAVFIAACGAPAYQPPTVRVAPSYSAVARSAITLA